MRDVGGVPLGFGGDVTVAGVFTGPFLLLRLVHRVKALVKAISGLGSSGTSERVLWSRRALSWSGYVLFRGEKF